MDYLTARGQSYAPVWKLDDMARELGVATKGLISYASISEKNGTLTNFFDQPGRPSDIKGMTAFVVSGVKQQLCDPNLELVIAGKFDVAAQKLTASNLLALREKMIASFQKAGIDLGFDINCKDQMPSLPMAALSK